MKFEISARQYIGGRSSQQDAWKAADKDGASVDAAGRGGATVTDQAIVILADGVGGQSGGDIASNKACDTFLRSFRTSKGKNQDRLTRALVEANQAVLDEQKRRPEAHDMATTLIAAVLDGRNMTFVSVGDSLLMRVRDNELHHVNVDHSYFDVVDRRALESGDPRAWGEARFDRRRKTITLALGATLSNPEANHSAQIDTRPMLPGDILILASDGIETLEFPQIQNIVRHAAPRGVSAIADGLITAVRGIAEASAAGERSFAQDNTTIVVVRADGPAPGALLGGGDARSVTNSLKNLLVLAGGGLLGILIALVAGWYFFAQPSQRQVGPPRGGAIGTSNPTPPSGNFTGPGQPSQQPQQQQSQQPPLPPQGQGQQGQQGQPQSAQQGVTQLPAPYQPPPPGSQPIDPAGPNQQSFPRSHNYDYGPRPNDYGPRPNDYRPRPKTYPWND
jgi:PPM family protein phosphatase